MRILRASLQPHYHRRLVFNLVLAKCWITIMYCRRKRTWLARGREKSIIPGFASCQVCHWDEDEGQHSERCTYAYGQGLQSLIVSRQRTLHASQAHSGQQKRNCATITTTTAMSLHGLALVHKYNSTRFKRCAHAARSRCLHI